MTYRNKINYHNLRNKSNNIRRRITMDQAYNNNKVYNNKINIYLIIKIAIVIYNIIVIDEILI